MSFQLHTVHQEPAQEPATYHTTTHLSTPHGALGTGSPRRQHRLCPQPFNSTRCIRNGVVMVEFEQLLKTFNSTRCSRNQSQAMSPFRGSQLSTPHGAVGTLPTDLQPPLQNTFNSTRCIRNRRRFKPWQRKRGLSTPHGALGTVRELSPFNPVIKAFNSTRCIRN